MCFEKKDGGRTTEFARGVSMRRRVPSKDVEAQREVYDRPFFERGAFRPDIEGQNSPLVT